jgi:hypothetical protein
VGQIAERQSQHHARQQGAPTLLDAPALSMATGVRGERLMSDYPGLHISDQASP